MKCFVHIGTEKTGTSMIQEFLHLNRELLAQFGCLFTKSAGLRNNNKLAIAAYSKSRQDHLTKRQGLFSDQDLRRFQKKIFHDLQSELRSFGLPKTVVFSSEHIQSRLRTPGEVSRLKGFLNHLGFYDIYIIVYLRRPVDIATSLYSTAVKAGALNHRPLPPSNEYYHNVCDHRATLIRFRDVFGDKSIIPRLYDKQEFKDGSIISDFMECIGLSQDMSQFHVPDSQNKSLSAIGIEILRRVNSKVPVFTDDDRPNKIRAGLVKYFQLNFDSGPLYTIPADLYQQYETEFHESNEWVRRTYFPEKKHLFSQSSYRDQTVVDIGEDGLDRIADLIAAIWIDKSEEMSKVTVSNEYRIAMILRRLKSRLLPA